MTMDVSMAIVLFCCVIQRLFCSVPGEINLAFRKPVSQSSTSWGILGLASNAVDGNMAQDFFHRTCSHTIERPGLHWWMVDLLDVHTIRSVRITNRKDCCREWLANVTIEVSRDNPFTLVGFPRRTSADVCIQIPFVYQVPRFPFECNAPVTGRYVRVFVEQDDPKSRLTMCEFEVYENLIITKYPVPATSNLALRKPTRQSDTWEYSTADLAVDGINNGVSEERSCAGTSNEGQSWWMVDLEDIHKVHIIRIMNRFDCCAHRLANFAIEVSEKDPSTLQGFPGRTNAPVCVTVKEQVPIPVPVNYECDQVVTGRYVRLVKNESLGISMCEFEVYEPTPVTTTDSPKTFGENGQWIFVFVKSYGFQHTHASMSEQRSLMDCARHHVHQRQNDTMRFPRYFQIDLPDGTCRFLQNLAESRKSLSSKWTVYELIRI